MPIDYKKYPADWKTKIRPDILERDGNKCKVCGVPNKVVVDRGWWFGTEVFQDMDGTVFDTSTGEAITSTYLGDIDKPRFAKIVLTIAHLDHDHTNNDYENLAALCQLHHLRLDAKQHKESSKITREKKKGQFKLEL